MLKFLRYNNCIHIIPHIFIGLDLFNRTKGNLNSLLIFMGLFLIIIINNYLRVNYFYKDGNKFFASIFVYLILSNFVIYNIGGYVDIFNFMIIYELILFTEGKRSRIFIGLAIATTFFISIFRHTNLVEILNLQFWQENSLDIALMAIYIIFYSTSLFSYKALRIEKVKVDRLNKELELSYTKLLEQSEKIEELTIAKERNRVAGEIHDSLGHSLVALNMNLDVAEKIIYKDIDTAKELLTKSKGLAKESMGSLRRAVYALKEEDTSLLAEKLQEIINNINSAGTINIILNQDESIESLPLEYKNIIYKSIKEAITNSIKHGKTDQMIIDIKLDDNNVNISIKDNGIGCSKLVKGNGLLGIENRISKINGKVNYESLKKQGFSMEIGFQIV